MFRASRGALIVVAVSIIVAALRVVANHIADKVATHGGFTSSGALFAIFTIEVAAFNITHGVADAIVDHTIKAALVTG